MEAFLLKRKYFEQKRLHEQSEKKKIVSSDSKENFTHNCNFSAGQRNKRNQFSDNLVFCWKQFKVLVDDAKFLLKKIGLVSL